MNKGDRQFTTIIGTDELVRYHNPNTWVIIDCRFDLGDFNWGRRSFMQSHISGSIFADLNEDLSAPVTSATGRHPLPDPNVFVDRLSHWGIEPQVQVVVVDTANGTFSVRLWWMLKAFGHERVAVLDGGFTKWVNESRPTSAQLTAPLVKDYRYEPVFGHRPHVNREFINQIIHKDNYRILDARAPERYRGEVEPIDAVAGRIPGALNRPTSSNLKPDGTLKSPADLRNEFTALLRFTPPEQTVVYCGSGVTSCHLILAMEVAGFHGAALYPGSWSEWIRNPNAPIEKG